MKETNTLDRGERRDMRGNKVIELKGKKMGRRKEGKWDGKIWCEMKSKMRNIRRREKLRRGRSGRESK